MGKSVKILLGHILVSSGLVFKYTKGKTKTNFLEDTGLQDKVIRRLAIIGEAVKGLPSDFKGKHKIIPWKDIAGMRDILVHEYYEVDTLLVWRVVKRKLPSMAGYLKKVLNSMEFLESVERSEKEYRQGKGKKIKSLSELIKK